MKHKRYPPNFHMRYASGTMRIVPTVVLALAATIGSAQQVEEQWHGLIESHKIDEADKLCTSWTLSSDLLKKVEAQKCLANVVLSRGSAVGLLGNDLGGGTLGEGYSAEAIDEAIKHLDEGIRLSPHDLSIHQGRLHILEVSGRFDQMVAALDESCTIYKGSEALPAWLAYAAELGEMGQARGGLAISEVLNRHYPDSHDILGNLGAFHNMLNEPTLALPYLQKAVDITPQDPIDTWNLGRAYDRLDQNEAAQKWYSKSLAIDSTGESSGERKCLYGIFVEQKLKDLQLACRLEKASCDENEQTACKAASTGMQKKAR